MADNEFTLGITITLPVSVAFGATVYAPATAEAHTFVPTYGISALELHSFSTSSNDAHLTYALSAAQALPVTLTYDGVTTPKFYFNVGITNTDGYSFPSDVQHSVVFGISSLGTALSSGVVGTMHDSDSRTLPATMTAQGSALSALYTLYINVSTPINVAYGQTIYAPATAMATVLSPAWNGLSSLNVASFSASASNSRLSYAISAANAFPVQLIWNGVSSTKFNFNIGITNNGGDTNTFNSVTFTMSSYGTALSANAGIRPMSSGNATSIVYDISATGLPASAITGFTATPRSNYMTLTWVNPTDIASANIRRSLTTTVDSVLSGELIYSGTSTTYNDTSSTGLSAFFYGAYAIDTDGNVSDIVSLSAMGTGSQPYDPSDDPTQNEADLYSSTNETYQTRRFRLVAEDII